MTSSRTENLVKVVVKLEKDEDDYPPADYEGLWALPVGEGLFQIDNVPFFARGIACGDIVFATAESSQDDCGAPSLSHPLIFGPNPQ